MLKIAICDDERTELQILKDYVNAMNLTSPYEVFCFHNGIDLLNNYTNKYAFDILILDMKMEPLNGIEVAEKIRQIDNELPILIVTSTVDYAVEGYKVNAFRYLVKPIEQEEFHRLFLQMLELLKKRNNATFAFPSHNGITRVPIKDIYYLESDLRKIRLVTTKGEFHFTGKISLLEEELIPHGFIRVHKSFLVNISKIQNIFKENITLDNQHVVPLSKHKKREVSTQFLNYMEIML